jgi:hypothetical protein
MSINTTTSSIAKHSIIYPNLDFWFEKYTIWQTLNRTSARICCTYQGIINVFYIMGEDHRNLSTRTSKFVPVQQTFRAKKTLVKSLLFSTLDNVIYNNGTIFLQSTKPLFTSQNRVETSWKKFAHFFQHAHSRSRFLWRRLANSLGSLFWFLIFFRRKNWRFSLKICTGWFHHLPTVLINTPFKLTTFE